MEVGDHIKFEAVTDHGGVREQQEIERQAEYHGCLRKLDCTKIHVVMTKKDTK